MPARETAWSDPTLFNLSQKPLSSQIDFAATPGRAVPRAMITRFEYAALASMAENIWHAGAPKNGAIIDAGSFIGASTLGLCEGLSRSPLVESEREGRIWSYDLFRAIPAIANKSLKGEGLKVGDSFRYLYDQTIQDYARYVRTFEGDILDAPKPDGPIAILFLDILWNWETTIQLADDFYTKLPPHRSLLVHQDFVYPYYPWIIISMGLLDQNFAFSKNIEASSVVFDVTREYRPESLDDLRNVPLQRALSYYDRYIDLLEGWAKGSVGLGKAMYLASQNKVDEASRLVDEIEFKFQTERRVVQYIESIRGYIATAVQSGSAKPLGKVASVDAGLTSR